MARRIRQRAVAQMALLALLLPGLVTIGYMVVRVQRMRCELTTLREQTAKAKELTDSLASVKTARLRLLKEVTYLKSLVKEMRAGEKAPSQRAVTKMKGEIENSETAHSQAKLVWEFAQERANELPISELLATELTAMRAAIESHRAELNALKGVMSNTQNALDANGITLRLQEALTEVRHIDTALEALTVDQDVGPVLMGRITKLLGDGKTVIGEAIRLAADLIGSAALPGPTEPSEGKEQRAILRATARELRETAAQLQGKLDGVDTKLAQRKRRLPRG